MWKHFEIELDYLVRHGTSCGWKIGPRRITNYELVFVLKGQGDIVIEGADFTVHSGDFICFRPGVLHSLSVTREPCMEIYGVHFTLPSEITELPLPDLFRIEPTSRIEALFKTMLQVHKEKPYLYQWHQNLLLQQILFEMISTLHQESMPAGQARIKKVLEYIHTDPYRAFTLEELSAQSGVRKTMFLQFFRHMTGTSPTQYIINLRLEHARDLLLETQLPISQIAEHCGFSDPFYFSRRFKARFLLSPQQYRKAHL